MQALTDLAADPEQGEHRWRDGAPIQEARNAHYTNTKEELEEALQGDFNFLEGDVWLEGVAREVPLLGRFREPIMAHDIPDVDGLTLAEWLKIGKLSGKGIKIDVKQSAALPKVLEAVQAADIPEERLILNADMISGPGWNDGTKFQIADALMDVKTSVEEMGEAREAFPRATIAIGLYTAAAPAGTTYREEQLREASRIAMELGGPVTFPLRAEFVTPEAVGSLKSYGSISVWNDPASYAPDDLEAERQRFREMGVDGMIDLRAKK